jgi:hypothetical protein
MPEGRRISMSYKAGFEIGRMLGASVRRSGFTGAVAEMIGIMLGMIVRMLGACLLGIMYLLPLGIAAGMVYIAYHFITKYW